MSSRRENFSPSGAVTTMFEKINPSTTPFGKPAPESWVEIFNWAPAPTSMPAPPVMTTPCTAGRAWVPTA
jgi:hypothetical protein